MKVTMRYETFEQEFSTDVLRKISVKFYEDFLTKTQKFLFFVKRAFFFKLPGLLCDEIYCNKIAFLAGLF